MKYKKILKKTLILCVLTILLFITPRLAYAGILSFVKRYAGTITAAATGELITSSLVHSGVNYFSPGQKGRSIDAFLSSAYISEPLSYHLQNFFSGNSGEKVTGQGFWNYCKKSFTGATEGASYGAATGYNYGGGFGALYGMAIGAATGQFAATLPKDEVKYFIDNTSITNGELNKKIGDLLGVDMPSLPSFIANRRDIALIPGNLTGTLETINNSATEINAGNFFGKATNQFQIDIATAWAITGLNYGIDKITGVNPQQEMNQFWKNMWSNIWEKTKEIVS